jgi:hypothetical protein
VALARCFAYFVEIRLCCHFVAHYFSGSHLDYFLLHWLGNQPKFDLEHHNSSTAEEIVALIDNFDRGPPLATYAVCCGQHLLHLPICLLFPLMQILSLDWFFPNLRQNLHA